MLSVFADLNPNHASEHNKRNRWSSICVSKKWVYHKYRN